MTQVPMYDGMQIGHRALCFYALLPWVQPVVEMGYNDYEGADPIIIARIRLKSIFTNGQGKNKGILHVSTFKSRSFNIFTENTYEELEALIKKSLWPIHTKLIFKRLTHEKLNTSGNQIGTFSIEDGKLKIGFKTAKL